MEASLGFRRAAHYAAKWKADADGLGLTEPTDEALAQVFDHCVRPAKPEEYDLIRDAIRVKKGQA